MESLASRLINSFLVREKLAGIAFAMSVCSELCALIPIVSEFGFNNNLVVSTVQSNPNNIVHKPAPVPFTWESEAANHVLEGVKNVQGRPFMIALVGIPGSGKSTSCHNVAHLVEEAGYPTMVMPFDGYHIPLDDLKTFRMPTMSFTDEAHLTHFTRLR